MEKNFWDLKTAQKFTLLHIFLKISAKTYTQNSSFLKCEAPEKGSLFKFPWLGSRPCHCLWCFRPPGGGTAWFLESGKCPPPRVGKPWHGLDPASPLARNRSCQSCLLSRTQRFLLLLPHRRAGPPLPATSCCTSPAWTPPTRRRTWRRRPSPTGAPPGPMDVSGRRICRSPHPLCPCCAHSARRALAQEALK